MAYSRGQEIMKSEPFTYVVKSEALSSYCDNCFVCKMGKQEMKRCSRCKIVYYCEASCQKLAWKNHHKEECDFLKDGMINTIFSWIQFNCVISVIFDLTIFSWRSRFWMQNVRIRVISFSVCFNWRISPYD